MLTLKEPALAEADLVLHSPTECPDWARRVPGGSLQGKARYFPKGSPIERVLLTRPADGGDMMFCQYNHDQQRYWGWVRSADVAFS